MADDEAHLLASTPLLLVYGNQADPLTAGAVRIVDKKGFIKVQRGRGMCIKTKAGEYLDAMKRALGMTWRVYQTELIARRDYYLCMGARVMDFSAQDFDQLELLTDLRFPPWSRMRTF